MRFRAAYFSLHDARGLEPHTGTQAFEHRHVADGPEIQIVLHRALQLGRVLDGNHPVVWGQAGERIEDRVDQRGLAAPGCADNKDVLSRAYGGADDLSVFQAAHPIEKVVPAAKVIQRVGSVGQYSVRFVVVKTEDLMRTQTNCEPRPSDHRRYDPLEPATIDGQLRFEDGAVMIQHGSPPLRDGSKRTRCLSRRHLADPGEAMSHPLHP